MVQPETGAGALLHGQASGHQQREGVQPDGEQPTALASRAQAAMTVSAIKRVHDIMGEKQVSIDELDNALANLGRFKLAPSIQSAWTRLAPQVSADSACIAGNDVSGLPRGGVLVRTIPARKLLPVLAQLRLPRVRAAAVADGRHAAELAREDVDSAAACAATAAEVLQHALGKLRAKAGKQHGGDGSFRFLADYVQPALGAQLTPLLDALGDVSRAEDVSNTTKASAGRASERMLRAAGMVRDWRQALDEAARAREEAAQERRKSRKRAASSKAKQLVTKWATPRTANLASPCLPKACQLSRLEREVSEAIVQAMQQLREVSAAWARLLRPAHRAQPPFWAREGKLMTRAERTPTTTKRDQRLRLNNHLQLQHPVRRVQLDRALAALATSTGGGAAGDETKGKGEGEGEGKGKGKGKGKRKRKGKCKDGGDAAGRGRAGRARKRGALWTRPRVPTPTSPQPPTCRPRTAR